MSQTTDNGGRSRRSEPADAGIGRRRNGDAATSLQFARVPVSGDALTDARLQPSGAAVDTFRTLALTVDRLLSESALRSLAILSARGGDGRSLTAELLARSLSEVRPPVRLLDADPFDSAPRVSRRRARARSRAPHARMPDVIDLVTDGKASYARLPVADQVFPNQPEFVATVRSVLAAATTDGATVIVDVPPCVASSIAFSVAVMADAVLYVARTRTEASPVHADVRAQLDLLGVHVLGVVLNESKR